MKYTVVFEDTFYGTSEFSDYKKAVTYAEGAKERHGAHSVIVRSETIWSSKTLEECLTEDEIVKLALETYAAEAGEPTKAKLNRHPDLDRHCMLPNRD